MSRERVGDAGVVLIVDDDESLRMLVATWLGRSGIPTIQAENGEAALAITADETQRIDAIVLDVMMPLMNGYEVLKQLKRSARSRMIPVVMLSAEATGEKDIVRGMDQGAVDHMLKPFSGPVLVAKVRSLCLRSLNDRRLLGRLEAAEERSTIDALTQLYNRRHFDARLVDESVEAVVSATGYALLMLDLDHFKAVNDTFGHSAGDRVLSHVAGVLKQVAGRIKEVARKRDTVFRYGGEEFAILLPGCDERDAIAAGERLAAALRDKPIRLGVTDYVITFSGGVASAQQENGFCCDRVVERADAALYRAKNEGRNRVVGESSP